MSERRYFSGDSEAQAVMEAAIHFGVEPEEVAYEQVDKKHGFVRRRRRVVIEVDPERPTTPRTSEAGPEEAPPTGTEEETVEPTRPEESPPTAAAGPEAEKVESTTVEATPDSAVMEAPTKEPEEPEETDVAEDTEDAEEEDVPTIDADQVQVAVDRLLDLADLDVHPYVEADDGELEVNITGPERKWLLEGNGSLLYSLEHLTLRMLWQQEGRFSSLRVDSDGYRDEREEELRSKARERARRVQEQGEAVELEALDPAERRIVHLTVEEIDGVESHSRGRGFRKRVRIAPD
ncbi:MAG: R3H domain-containing nucleic acid-binding protein [Thermoanaerobaculia bacterium]|nr:R3H domain-containing nucleic acid-binding protein [Thermoanaerobaculia bacterium]